MESWDGDWVRPGRRGGETGPGRRGRGGAEEGGVDENPFPAKGLVSVGAQWGLGSHLGDQRLTKPAKPRPPPGLSTSSSQPDIHLS